MYPDPILATYSGVALLRRSPSSEVNTVFSSTWIPGGTNGMLPGASTLETHRVWRNKFSFCLDNVDSNIPERLETCQGSPSRGWRDSTRGRISFVCRRILQSFLYPATRDDSRRASPEFGLTPPRAPSTAHIPSERKCLQYHYWLGRTGNGKKKKGGAGAVGREHAVGWQNKIKR